MGDGIFAVVGGDGFAGEFDPMEDVVVRNFPIAGFDGDVDARAGDDEGRGHVVSMCRTDVRGCPEDGDERQG